MHHAGNKNAGDKNLRQRTAKAQTKIVSDCREPEFCDSQAIIHRLYPKKYSSSHNLNHGPKSRQAEGQDRAQEVRICEDPTTTKNLATDSFCHLGAQDPLVLRLATESSSPRRLLC
jgi:hypothetical protein